MTKLVTGNETLEKFYVFFTNKIGSGSYGIVYDCFNTRTMKNYAIKVFSNEVC